jgi:hypothetical protein
MLGVFTLHIAGGPESMEGMDTRPEAMRRKIPWAVIAVIILFMATSFYCINGKSTGAHVLHVILAP